LLFGNIGAFSARSAPGMSAFMSSGRPSDLWRRGKALLTSTEVASLFGVDRRTVVLWAKRGLLPSVRTPGGQHRFRADQIHRVLKTNGEEDACALAGPHQNGQSVRVAPTEGCAHHPTIR
jgi:excisionase family DNA binding protein